MLQFEINQPNKILVQLPRGKIYLTDEKKLSPQSKQKGSTCWYYILNHLRPRFGKTIDALVDAVEKQDELKELRTHSDYKALKMQRYIEKEISHYRKKLTQLDEEEKLTATITPSLPNTTKQFHEKRIQETINVARKLGCEALVLDSLKRAEEMYRTLDLFLKLLGMKDGQIEEYRLQTRSGYLHNMLHSIFSNYYGLKSITWRPNKSIHDLIKQLQTAGSFSVAGKLGIPFYNAPPKKANMPLGSQDVYFWDSKKSENGLHSVLIVGAEIRDDQSYVYYIDPNETISSTTQNGVFRMPYDEFCSSLSDTHNTLAFNRLLNILGAKLAPDAKEANDAIDIAIKQILETGIFGFHSDEEMKEEARKQYDRVIAKVLKIKPTFFEQMQEQKKQAQLEIFRSIKLAAMSNTYNTKGKFNLFPPSGIKKLRTCNDFASMLTILDELAPDRKPKPDNRAIDVHVDYSSWRKLARKVRN